MAKYRLVKIEEINENGEIQVWYEIQKKFLFFWICPLIEFQLYSHDYLNAHHFGIPSSVAITAKRRFAFDDRRLAEKVMNKIKFPFKIRYKGDLIERIFSNDLLSYVYVNRSHTGLELFRNACEYSYSLDELKSKIDSRKIKIRKSII